MCHVALRRKAFRSTSVWRLVRNSGDACARAPVPRISCTGPLRRWRFARHGTCELPAHRPRPDCCLEMALGGTRCRNYVVSVFATIDALKALALELPALTPRPISSLLAPLARGFQRPHSLRERLTGPRTSRSSNPRLIYLLPSSSGDVVALFASARRPGHPRRHFRRTVLDMGSHG